MISYDAGINCIYLFDYFVLQIIIKVLHRDELLNLTGDLLGRSSELQTDLTKLLYSSIPLNSAANEFWENVPLSDVDFSESSRCTPR